MSFMSCPSGSPMPSVLIIFPLSMIITPHFFTPNNSEYRKMRTKKSSVFEPFSPSDRLFYSLSMSQLDQCVSFYSFLTLLSMNSWSFVSRLYDIHFVQIVVHSLFLVDYTSFQLIFQSFISKSRADMILIYSYQLHCHLPGLFGTVLSFQRSI